MFFETKFSCLIPELMSAITNKLLIVVGAYQEPPYVVPCGVV